MYTLLVIFIHIAGPTFIKYEATSASIKVLCAPSKVLYAPTIIDNASWMASRVSGSSYKDSKNGVSLPADI